jgi:hypothetical protein
MSRSLTIRARWDRDASVWLATSEDLHGLVVAGTWPQMICEVELVLPDLMEVLGFAPEIVSDLHRREHLDPIPGASTAQKSVLDLLGRLEWDSPYDYKSERSRD